MGHQRLSSHITATNTTNGFTEILFSQIKDFFNDEYHWDIRYLKLKITRHGENNNGSINHTMSDSSAGFWTSKGYIGLAPDDKLVDVQKRYNVSHYSLMKFKILILAHEMSHEVWNRVLSDSEKETYRALSKETVTEYTKTIDADDSKLDEEQFCEYIALATVQHFSD